ncbi:MAG: glycosyltransferase [Dehalococcoidia bacterium]
MRILVLTLDLAGNWPPELQLIRVLCRRGHEVRVVSSDGHQAAVESAGARFEPFQFAAGFDSNARYDWAESEQIRVTREVLLNTAYADELQAAIERERPDLLLLDQVLFLSFPAAEASDIPFVLMAHSLLGASRARPFPPFFAQAINAARERVQLEPIEGPETMHGRSAILDFTYAELDTPFSPPLEDLHYVGPLLDQHAAPAFELPWPNDDSRPLILVSFSSGFQNQAEQLGRVVDALSSLPVRALVTLGHAILPSEIRTGPNVVALPFVPHASVLPKASLVITHAGHGTTIAAATAGIPLLCMPMGRDQFMVSAAAKRVGIAEVISMDATSKEIALAVSAALADEELSSEARAFAARQDVDAGRRLAVDVIERLG